MRLLSVCVLLVACGATSDPGLDTGGTGGEAGATTEPSTGGGEALTGGPSSARTVSATGGALATGGAVATGGTVATGGKAATGGRVSTGGATVAATTAAVLCIVTATSTQYVGPEPACASLGELYCPCIFSASTGKTYCSGTLVCDACNRCEGSGNG